jgi:hypothetical protein
MLEMTEWAYMGDTENGLQIWCKINAIDGEKHLRIQYKTNDGERIGGIESHKIKKIRLLNGLIDCCCMDFGWDIAHDSLIKSK